MYKKIRNILISKREYIYLLAAIIGVYLIAIHFVDGTKSLSVYGDELGYWQGAAFFLGIDWSEIASVNEYYGCGYGPLLALVMKIWKNDSVVMMQMAVRMQGMILSSCVFIIYKCLNMIADNLSCFYKIVLATVTVLYPCNLLFVNIVLAECILNWCIWILFFLYLKYEKERKTCQLFLIMLLSVYMYLIHARTLAILIATLIVFFLRVRDNLQKEKKKIIFCVVLFFVSIIMIMLLKHSYVESFYTKKDYVSKTGDLAAQVGNAINIMSSLGRVIDMLYSVCGKLYYMLIGSLFMVGFGVILCIKSIISAKKNSNNCLSLFWLILAFVFAWGIDALYMSTNFNTRSDILIYGRYLEYICGPIMLMGMLYLLQKPKGKYLAIILFVGLVLSILVIEKMPNEAKNTNIWLNCSAIARPFYIFENNKEALLYATLSRCFCIFVLLLICQLNYRKYKIVLINMLIGIGVFWVLQFNIIWTKHVVPWRDDNYENQSSLLALIGDNSFALYDAKYPGFFQFLKVESEVYVFQSIEECINNKSIDYFISDSDCEEIDWITENANVIEMNSRYVLWDID